MKRYVLLCSVMLSAAVAYAAVGEKEVEETRQELDKSVMFYDIGGLYHDIGVEVGENSYMLKSRIMEDFLLDEDHERFAKSKCKLIDHYMMQHVKRIFPSGYVEVRLFNQHDQLMFKRECE